MPEFLETPQAADITPRKIHEIEAASRKFTNREATWIDILVSQPTPPCLGYSRMEDVEDTS